MCFTPREVQSRGKGATSDFTCVYAISGLLPVLDSECSRGGAASDATLVATYNKHFKSHANFSVCGPSTGWRRTNDSHSLTNHDDFVVIHFAGPVIYTCVDFVDRNRDALFEHVNSLMGTSKNKMVR